ncbi:type II secretion system protein J [Candidatus Omnitrophota bacterium]
MVIRKIFYEWKNEKNARGFTVIEMIVALSIFSVIALTLYAAYSNAVQLDRRSKSVGQIYRQANWATETLARDLENVVPFHYSLEGDRRVHKVIIKDSTSGNVRVLTGDITEEETAELQLFKGDQEALSLIVAGPQGLEYVRYFISEPQEVVVHKTLVNTEVAERYAVLKTSSVEEKEKVLVREAILIKDVATGESKGRQEILARRLTRDGLRFAYARRSSLGGTDALDWENSWKEDLLPVGVRIDLAFLGDEEAEAVTMQKNILIPVGVWGQ